ncbi:PucR family transcriptional regulator [Pseudonocardia thermophila]|jgi:Sugar diacid utilization regulator|uniref:PucR family transcriptional regulator n=1 Tax=Pseudonocardia thermophila TaxID=1848 RepID=UPI00248DC34B|nr:helix-turn-helix domain-containing protein [Pseudonocardia thermophila]
MTTSGVPVDGSAAAYIQHGMRAHETRELVGLRRFVAMCSHLSATAAQQTELEPILRFFAANTRSSAAVLDRGLEVLAAAGETGAEEIVARTRAQAGTTGLKGVLAAVARNRRALRLPGHERDGSVVIAPVSVGDEIAGYLVSVARPDDDPAGIDPDLILLAAEHTALVCGVMLGREIVVAAAAGRARRELIEGLLRHRGQDDGEAAQWAKHLGYDENRPHAVLAVALGTGDRAASQPAVEGLLTRLAGDAILSARSDEVVAIVPAPTATGDAVERARRIATSCVRELDEHGLSVTAVGIGNAYKAASEISVSYSEARRAVAAAKRMGPGRITLFAELGIHRLLLRFPDPTELRAFADDVLGRLVREDETAGTEYLTTLSVYFKGLCSPTRAAKELHVHPNTVVYRLRRIEEITGLRLDLQRDRLMMEMAVEILEGTSAR